ncbi:MAG: alpha/beta hydrolase [Pseudomonadota bacterium]|nr:alpha/beta hydrolase [Pseudomonadota bacterium]
MTAFVLIHGGFMGGWVWKPTVQVLAAAAHEVYAPTLDGCGERASQVRPGITLTSQAEEVAEMLFLQDINDAVLVSTSTGGLVAAKTAELARKRIRHLVFVDALAPQPGEAISDIVIPQPNMSYEFTELTRVLSRSFMETGMFRDLQPDLRSWAMARYTPHPISTSGSPGELDSFWAQSWSATVINCIRDPNPPETHQRRTAETLNAPYLELDAGHFPMLSHPEELAALLLSI